MIALDLRNQQALDANPKLIQQINFTGNLARDPSRFFKRNRPIGFFKWNR